MTEKEKDILISRMLDPDSTLTDDELREIGLDDELKDILSVSSAVRSAVMPQPEIDVEREWRLFRHRILPRPSLRRGMMRVAAIFLGVVAVSAIIRIVIDRAASDPGDAVMVEAAFKEPDVGNEYPDDLAEQTADESATRHEEIAVSGVVSVRERTISPQTSAGSVDPDEELDVDEYLRQQQAEIDNDIAWMLAEIRVEEADALGTAIDYDVMTSYEQESNIKHITIP